MADIRTLTDVTAAHVFYNAWCHDQNPCAQGNGGLQSPLNLVPVARETVESWFFNEDGDRLALGAYEGDRLVGMVAATVDGVNRHTGYLSYLCVDPAFRGKGIGLRLLGAMTDLLERDPRLDQLEVVFRNPVALPWYIPNGGEDYHPCLPGVDKASALFLLFKNHGWREFATQNAYYRRLTGYRSPKGTESVRERLATEGIELTLYDPAHHHGLAELFDDIRNPDWKMHVMAQTHLPIVVAVDTKADGLVVGYTGPLTVTGTPSRGNFHGIGTLNAYRGRGIGKQIFCEMCRRHAEGGADFMSLYTGEDNPARLMYEAAGFRIVRSFADMRRVIRRK